MTSPVAAAQAAAAGQGAAPPAAAVAESWPAQRNATFRVVWSTVNEAYFDETFGGVDWRAVGERYRERLDATGTNDELRHLLQSMLGELGRSHFAIMPREAMVLHATERSRLGATGIELATVETHVVVTRVHPNSAAARAGLRVGTRLVSVDACELDAIAQAMRQMNVPDHHRALSLVNLASARLNAPVGTTIALTGQQADGREFSVELASEAHSGAWSEPLGNFPSQPLDCVVESGSDGIVHLRFNAFAPTLMKQIRNVLRGLGTDQSLLLDLRGNPGGVADMASGIAGLLVDRELVLGEMKLRKGTMRLVAHPQERAFLGPIAVLIDGASASTSEILAASLRDHGRARLFGSRTAGAALPSVVRSLPNGDVFQYAIADVRTPKDVTIEGRGVEPDVWVTPTLDAVARGSDPVLEAARAWLQSQRRADAPASENAAPVKS